MRIVYFMLLFLCIAHSSVITSAHAQSSEMPDIHPFDVEDTFDSYMDLSYHFNPLYEFEVRKAYTLFLAGKEHSFNEMRRLYPRTSHYDPDGQHATLELTRFAEMALRSQTSEQKQKYAENFKALALQHLANIDAVLLAQSYARENPIFGNLKFYEWARSKLVDSIVAINAGLTIQSAYNLVTLGEEQVIFNFFKVLPFHTELISNGGRFHHIHMVAKIHDERKSQMYMDLSLPMQALKRQYKANKSERRNRLGIIRQ